MGSLGLEGEERWEGGRGQSEHEGLRTSWGGGDEPQKDSTPRVMESNSVTQIPKALSPKG